jgi:signal transduction histidine kinase
VVLEANAAAGVILGHDAARLQGKPLAALIGLPERRSFRRALLRLGPDGEERLSVHPRGGAEEWQLALRRLPRVSPVTVIATLAHERAAPPQRPRASTRMQYFMLRFPYAVVALRPDMRIAFANARARALFGRDAVRTGELLGASVPPALRMLASRIVHVPAPLTPTTVETGDQTLRVSGIAATPVEPALLLVEDVTEQYRRDRVMHEFLRNAAHQLRTPLAGIAAAVETLQAGAKEQPETRDLFLEHLEAHVARLTRIARGLLTLARRQAGERVPVDAVELAPLLEQVAAGAQPRDGVRLVVDCSPGLAAIAARDLLQEALAALVENAAAHTSAGEIRIHALEDRRKVRIEVSDTGPGILPEFRERIFEPFFQIGHGGGEGYGLGLAIAARAVEAMDGQIEVDDGAAGGTTFSVTLRSAAVAA